MSERPRILGVDYGAKRIGLAYGDDLGVATALPALLEPDPGQQVARLAALARQRQITTIVVGYPLQSDGTVGTRAREVDAFIRRLKAALPGVQVDTMDERHTSQAAGAHWSLRRLRAKRATGELDSASAVLILNDWLTLAFPAAGQPASPDDPGFPRTGEPEGSVDGRGWDDFSNGGVEGGGGAD